MDAFGDGGTEDIGGSNAEDEREGDSGNGYGHCTLSGTTEGFEI